MYSDKATNIGIDVKIQVNGVAYLQAFETRRKTYILEENVKISKPKDAKEIFKHISIYSDENIGKRALTSVNSRRRVEHLIPVRPLGRGCL